MTGYEKIIIDHDRENLVYNQDMHYNNYGNHSYHNQEDNLREDNRHHFYHDYTSYYNVNSYHYDF